MKNSLWNSEKRRRFLRALVFIVLASILTVGAVLAARSIIQAWGIRIRRPSEPYFNIWFWVRLALTTRVVLVIVAWLLGVSLIFWLVSKKNPVWNSEQRRVRALWRLMAQLLLLVVVTAVFLFPLLFIILFPSVGVLSLIDLVPLGLVSLLVVLFSVWLSGKLLDRRPFADFGFHFSRRWWIDFAFGLALGAVLVVGIFLIEKAIGWIRYTSIVLSPWEPVAHALVIGLAIFLSSLINGVQVQLVSRGYQMRNLAEGLNLPFIGPRAALLLAYLGSSFVILLPHLNRLIVRYTYLLPRHGFFNEVVLFAVNLIINGLFLGLGYLLTGELAIPIGLHTAWNFSKSLLFGQGIAIFGFPGSGYESIVETFIKVYEDGPSLWSGARYLGLEAGLLGLLAAVVGSLLIVLWVRWHHGSLGLQDRLAEYRPPTLPQRQTEGEAE